MLMTSRYGLSLSNMPYLSKPVLPVHTPIKRRKEEYCETVGFSAELLRLKISWNRKVCHISCEIRIFSFVTIETGNSIEVQTFW